MAVAKGKGEERNLFFKMCGSYYYYSSTAAATVHDGAKEDIVSKVLICTGIYLLVFHRGHQKHVF